MAERISQFNDIKYYEQGNHTGYRFLISDLIRQENESEKRSIQIIQKTSSGTAPEEFIFHSNNYDTGLGYGYLSDTFENFHLPKGYQTELMCKIQAAPKKDKEQSGDFVGFAVVNERSGGTSDFPARANAILSKGRLGGMTREIEDEYLACVEAEEPYVQRQTTVITVMVDNLSVSHPELFKAERLPDGIAGQAERKGFQDPKYLIGLHDLILKLNPNDPLFIPNTFNRGCSDSIRGIRETLLGGLCIYLPKNNTNMKELYSGIYHISIATIDWNLRKGKILTIGSNADIAGSVSGVSGSIFRDQNHFIDSTAAYFNLPPDEVYRFKISNYYDTLNHDVSEEIGSFSLACVPIEEINLGKTRQLLCFMSSETDGAQKAKEENVDFSKSYPSKDDATRIILRWVSSYPMLGS